MDDLNIVGGLVELITKAEIELPYDVIAALKKSHEKEVGIAKLQIENILRNIDIAKKTGRPMCQDTGIHVFFVEIGTDFPHIKEIKESIIKAVRKATKIVPLRPNTVDPLSGKNSVDNIGNYIPNIYWDIKEGNDVSITILPKGGGSENVSKLKMFKPGDSIENIKDFVVEHIVNVGGSPCPPTVVGVGIGGGSGLSLNLAQKALLRPVGKRNQDEYIAKIEEEMIRRINESGVGPMGLGGKTTVLDVHIEKAHRHPASLPVGIVVQCWADRRANMIIHSDGSWELK